jgi:hypothetical protein
MVIVRLVFQAKYGKAHEVVDEFKNFAEVARRFLGPDRKGRILTDLSGPFDTVVQEFEVASLAEWEQLRAKMFSSPEFQDSKFNNTDMHPFVGGRTEFYTLEATL